MVQALLVLAAEEETSKTAFYIAGVVLAGFAVGVSALGITQPNFVAAQSASRGVMALCAVLVIAAVATSVITG